MTATSQKKTQKYIKPTPPRGLASRHTQKTPPRIPPGYTVSNSLPVLTLLSKHRGLEPVLEDMLKVFPLFFDSINRVDLQVVFDDPNSLIACVVTSDPDALQRLERFDEKWWLPNAERAGNRPFVTIDHL